MIYLDHAAASPLDKGVLAAMQPYFSDVFYNPSATYLPARQAKEALESARASVAFWLGVRPAEVVFVAGGTEANNLAIAGIMNHFPGASVVVSSIEHDSVLEPAGQYMCRIATATPQGRVDLDSLRASVQDDTVVVSVMYANNEVGTIQPLRQIAAFLDQVRTERRNQGNTLPLYFHTDACQASNYLDLHVSRLGVDLMTLNGGKIYGPKQSGVLYVASHVQLDPLIRGGGQERRLRSGTENVAGAVGFAAALEAAQTMRETEGERLSELQRQFFAGLKQQLPAAVINGSTKNRLPNNLHITLPAKDNERMLIQLEQAGILAAAGSACSASDEEPSHVLRAIGLSDADARSSLRFTMGRSTTSEHIEQLLEALLVVSNK